VVYRERGLAVPATVLWQRHTRAGAILRILPDGCLDLIWDGENLIVAGPDTRARLHRTVTASSYVGLRFAGGLGAAVLGVPADELRDQSPVLDAVWSAAQARTLADRVARDPAATLEGWVQRRIRETGVDLFGQRVAALARSGAEVREMADAVGLSPRQLHRRCLTLFGYGPRHLARVLRLGRALDQARQGTPLARVAPACGYADQAHLARDVRDLTGVTATEWLAESTG
jgi:AraC-like DNA-binding protein